MRHAINELVIRGSAEQVMALAFDLPRWPAFLPHYRWVRVLARDGERQTVEMACWRGGIPLRWRSHLWVLPEERRMRFHHIAGPARGMEVEWTLREEAGGVRVAIHHDLSLDVPVVRSALGRWVVGEVFVRAVATRTLSCLKQAVERGA
jgi:coenzyme Q-binding protein COQ10